MGLDTSHDCWHGAYSLFAAWRCAVAEAAGYPLKEVHVGPGQQVDVPYDEFQTPNYKGKWGDVPDDPLFVLFIHSDCDGVIHPREGAALADRLEELLPYLEIDNQNHLGGVFSYVFATERFIHGLRLAASADEDVVFG